MQEIKIRYTFKRRSDGHIWQEIVPLDCLEGRGDKPFILRGHAPYWTLLGKDLFTGRTDKKGNDVYSGDIMKVVQRTIGSGKKTKYKDFHIAVEFYKGSFILPFQNYGEYRFRDGDIEHFEVIGNIYENAALLAQ
jgi:hypothetical protein